MCTLVDVLVECDATSPVGRTMWRDGQERCLWQEDEQSLASYHEARIATATPTLPISD
ncbi:hypothetical protein DACRYDRAFT_23798 [Dacryopinax primogenitus]|uniref:Uncharacterized protein n=1 Tax=Dacryopinax primogenitus (strain DJM 731) TaxID=1858805 RepID=M5FT50_DACPD|nr:uncharacterized protein DACRYDRAFT_23798 [Dacryopinax primogenitus]EJT99178.1 hypothetical protein DACRYDRAFT_23798 [Dacryopinax primogenitus]